MAWTQQSFEVILSHFLAIANLPEHNCMICCISVDESLISEDGSGTGICMRFLQAASVLIFRVGDTRAVGWTIWDY